jgi:hypothetical protein
MISDHAQHLRAVVQEFLSNNKKSTIYFSEIIAHVAKKFTIIDSEMFEEWAQQNIHDKRIQFKTKAQKYGFLED